MSNVKKAHINPMLAMALKEGHFKKHPPKISGPKTCAMKPCSDFETREIKKHKKSGFTQRKITNLTGISKRRVMSVLKMLDAVENGGGEYE